MDRGSAHSLRELRDFLREHLLGSVMPFWLRHTIDDKGGINTCIKDDGTILSRDKWLWSQWRAVWVFSTLYTMVEPRREWIEVAEQICEFVSRHGWDDHVGGWVLCLGGDGTVMTGCDSIYTDGFAIYGLVALAKATGKPQPIQLARQTAEHLVRRLQSPHDQIPHFPYPVPTGARVHGIPMMFSLILWELGQHLDDESYRRIAQELSDDVFANFYRPDRDVVLERIAADNSEYPPPLGTAVVPGHAIEDMWFQIHIARDRQDRQRIDQAVQLIRRHVEMGWDGEHKGLLLAVDADGRNEVGWKFADTKPWWPQTEAMYALLLAYEHCREDWALSWYHKVHEYCFSHYPVADHGEWRQKLTRSGAPLTETIALPVKDPFHLPRALIYCVDVLDRLISS